MTTIHTIEDLVRLLDERPEWVEALRSRLLTRELIELPERFAAFAAKTEEEFGRVHQEIADFKAEMKAETNKRFGRIETTLAQMRNEISNLRGIGATSAAFHKAAVITQNMGLEYVRPLSYEYLWEMTHNVDQSAFQRGDLASFNQADLVMECQDPQGRDMLHSSRNLLHRR